MSNRKIGLNSVNQLNVDCFLILILVVLVTNWS